MIIDKKISVMIILMLGFVLSGCSDESSESVMRVDRDLVSSLEVTHDLRAATDVRMFDPSSAQGKEVVDHVVSWLNEAKMTNGPLPSGKEGYKTTATLNLRDGGKIHLEPVYECTTKKDDQGTIEKQCAPVEGEVYVKRDEHTTRYRSEALAQWLATGWKNK